MYVEATGLMRKLPILDHSSIDGDELATVLLCLWSRYCADTRTTERWTQVTAGHLVTLRELITKNEPHVTILVIKGLISEVRHLTHDDVMKLIEESLRRKQVCQLLKVLGLNGQHYESAEEIYQILKYGKLLDTRNEEILPLKLRDHEVTLLSTVLILSAVSDDGEIDNDGLLSTLRDWLEQHRGGDYSAAEFSEETLDELLRYSRFVGSNHIRALDDVQTELLFSYTTTRTLAEVLSRVRLRKECLFSEEELEPVEKVVLSYPSLTTEGMAIGKIIAYTLGRMPLADRRKEIVRRLTELQKKESILIFSHPGQHDITPQEVIRLSDFSNQFVVELIGRTEIEATQDFFLALAKQAKLLDQN